ncbi:MAG: hypothetical protein ACYCQI_02505 [Gammaproteobacteria bacterium]
MSASRESKTAPREVLEECFNYNSIKTLLFMIQSGAIDVESLFTSPVLNEQNAWILTRLFYVTDRRDSYEPCELWKSLLPCMLNTLHAKGFKPRPERTLALLQLIACTDFTRIEYWLDVFASFHDKQEYIKIVNQLIVTPPKFTKLANKNASYFSSFHLQGFHI